MTRRNRKILVPEARDGLNQLKQKVVEEKGHQINSPEEAKFEVAEDVGVPLKKGYNGTLTAKEAGKVGGNMGGSMVRELIKIAQNNLKNQ